VGVIWVRQSNLEAAGAFCENRRMDLELILPIGFVLLAALGLVYGGLAGYYYVQGERSAEALHVPVAVVAFAMQYGLFFTLTTALRHDGLLPIIFIFLTTMALIIAIRLGLQARSKSGTRVAMAGVFTLGAYICKMGSDYHQFVRRYR
jgi:hypothetical protein